MLRCVAYSMVRTHQLLSYMSQKESDRSYDEVKYSSEETTSLSDQKIPEFFVEARTKVVATDDHSYSVEQEMKGYQYDEELAKHGIHIWFNYNIFIYTGQCTVYPSVTVSRYTTQCLCPMRRSANL